MDDLTEHFCYSREKLRTAIFLRDKIAFLLKPMGRHGVPRSTNLSFPGFMPRSPSRTPARATFCIGGFLLRPPPGKAPSRFQETRLLSGCCGSCSQRRDNPGESSRGGDSSHSTGLGPWRFLPRPHAYGCFPYRKIHETSRSSKPRGICRVRP